MNSLLTNEEKNQAIENVKKVVSNDSSFSVGKMNEYFFKIADKYHPNIINEKEIEALCKGEKLTEENGFFRFSGAPFLIDVTDKNEDEIERIKRAIKKESTTNKTERYKGPIRFHDRIYVVNNQLKWPKQGKTHSKDKEGWLKWICSRLEIKPFPGSIYEEYQRCKDKKDTTNAKLEQDNLFLTSSEEEYKSLIENNKQIIFTGAPGTGKTYSVKKVVNHLADDKDKYVFIQFHSSYDYTDFVEGIRPIEADDKKTVFVKMDGLFKEFCRKIVQETIDRLRESENEEIVRLSLSKKFGMNYREDLEKIKNEINRLNYNPSKENMRAKRIIEEEINEVNYYFIIDEINRADLGRVFGELMYGLEEAYRGVEHQFRTQYSNLPTYKSEIGKERIEIKQIEVENDCFIDGFFVPRNLYLIGTMNDIDRSVETIDFAMRRRFQWKEVEACGEDVKSALGGMLELVSEEEKQILEDLSKRIECMNKYISEASRYGLSKAYAVGIGYFKELRNCDDKKNIVSNKVLDKLFKSKIEPLLNEYLRGFDEDEKNKFVEECKKRIKNPEKYTYNTNSSEFDDESDE